MVDDVVVVAQDRLRQYIRARKGSSSRQVEMDTQALAYIVAITSGIEDQERREAYETGLRSFYKLRRDGVIQE